MVWNESSFNSRYGVAGTTGTLNPRWMDQVALLTELLHTKNRELEELRNKERIMEQQLTAMAELLNDKKNSQQKQQQFQGEQEQEDQEELAQMVELSIQAKENSYSPYSKFRVGCILKTASGHYYKGCNVENASYGLTICAERTAIVKAVSEGHTRFSKIVVATDLQDSFVFPCGACRQVLREFGDMTVYMVKPDRSVFKTQLSDLLPYSFTQQDLEKHSRQS